MVRRASVGVIPKEAHAIRVSHDAVLRHAKGLKERTIGENAGELERSPRGLQSFRLRQDAQSVSLRRSR